MKPFDRERFSAALARARARRESRRAGRELARRLGAVLAELQQSRGHAAAGAGAVGRADPLRAGGDIDWIEAADNYVAAARGGRAAPGAGDDGGDGGAARSRAIRADPPVHDREPRRGFGSCSRRSTGSTWCCSTPEPSSRSAGAMGRAALEARRGLVEKERSASLLLSGEVRPRAATGYSSCPSSRRSPAGSIASWALHFRRTSASDGCGRNSSPSRMAI